jgi:hypothetical protein
MRRRRRISYVCALVSLLTLSPAHAAAKPGTSWAQAELKTVVAAGLMARTAAARPNDPLTKGELETIVAGLTHAQPVVSPVPTAKVTMAALDSRLVTALGLADTAKVFTQSAKTAGLAPPSRFGTEAVANLRRGPRRPTRQRGSSSSPTPGTPRASAISRRASSCPH